MPIQLDQVSLIGPEGYAQKKLAELCPIGAHVIIIAEGTELKPDAFGILHGVVYRNFPGPVDPAAPPVPADKNGLYRSALQLEMIRAGWAVAINSRSPLHQAWQHLAPAALQQAHSLKLGAYSLPEFIDKEVKQEHPVLVDPTGKKLLPMTTPALKPNPLDDTTVQPVPKSTPGANGF
jgi:hypothetical protein